MDASMIERVAEAIFLKEGRAQDVAWVDADKVLALTPQRWGTGEKPPLVSDYYRAIARAAITAMREPTEAMVLELVGYEETAMEKADGWRDAIDEALK